MRRVLSMKKTLAVALTCAMFGTACSTAWVATVDSILAAAAPALINILQIVAVANGQPLNTNLAARVGADSTLIRTLAADFAKASSGSAPAVCQQLQAAVSVYEADQQLVLQAAQVSDSNTQSKIMLLAGLVAGTVNAIAGAIPPCQQTFSPRRMEAAAPYQVSTFAAHYNSILVAKTGNAAVDAITPELKLHQRSRLLQAVTFGKFQR